MAGGTYRYWERFLIFLVIANFVTFPMALLVHANAGTSVAGVVPSLPGGLNATLLLVIVAVVGTTVEPWQMFFQQSNVVDKRITPRWLNYERLDTRDRRHHRGDRGRGADGRRRLRPRAYQCLRQLQRRQHHRRRPAAHVGHGVGDLMALAMIDGSLIGANLTAMTTTYTLGDMSRRCGTPCTDKPRQAPWFYGLYAILIAVSAVVTLAVGQRPRRGHQRGRGAQRDPAAVRADLPDPAGQRQALARPVGQQHRA